MRKQMYWCLMLALSALTSLPCLASGPMAGAAVGEEQVVSLATGPLPMTCAAEVATELLATMHNEHPGFVSGIPASNHQVRSDAQQHCTIYNGPLYPGQNIYTGNFPRFVAIGDLDSDGRPDLAVANEFSNTVSVLLNLGNGTFAYPVDFATGTSPTSVAIGDLDGNGRPDLVVANTFNGAGGNTLSVLRNSSSTVGTIDFTERVDYPAGGNPRSIAIGDLNSDGHPDVAVANYVTNTVIVFQNMGDGALANTVSYFAGGNPSSVVIGDVDGDGRLDLAVANQFSGVGGNSVSVLRNISSDGGAVALAALVNFASGALPSSVAIGDLDGDNRPELAVTNISSSTVSVLRNVSTVGVAAFATRVVLGTGSMPVSVKMGDLDGDNRSELIVRFNNTNDDSVSVLRNISSVGNLSFAARVEAGVDGCARDVTIGDLDGDSRPDLAIANVCNNTVKVLRNRSIGAGDIAFASRVDFATGSSPGSVAIGDLDGDGLADLAVANGSSNSVSVLRNLGSGVYALRVDYATGNGPTSVAIGDLDGDGPPDLVVACGIGVSVLRNLGKGVYAARVDYATGFGSSSVAIGDLDGGGRPDLAVANFGSNTVSVLLNLGNGVYAVHVEYATGFNPWSIAIGDLDGDGLADLVVACGIGVSVLRNLGNGVYAARVDYSTGSFPSSIAIGDLDGDGLADLAVANWSSSSVSVLLNQLPPPVSLCPGDANCDRMVTFLDIAEILVTFGNTTTPYGPGDADGNGMVNFTDVAVTLNNFGNVCGP